MKNQTGGFISIEYLVAYFEKRGEAISLKDIINATKKLNVLGSEIQILTLSDGKKYIGMISMNNDQIKILQLAKVEVELIFYFCEEK